MSDIQTTPQRVRIVGTSGSGKTTVGRQLAEVLGVPFYEMDALYWRPGWREAPRDEFRTQLESIVGGDGWVIDGNYDAHRDITWPRAEMVVWMDLPLRTTLWNVARRTWARGRNGCEVWPGSGCHETLGKALLTRDSILLWVLTSYASNRRRYTELESSERYPQLEFARLRSAAQARCFVAEMAERRARRLGPTTRCERTD